jgi:DNA-binding IscR family transcriptional regulator
MPACYLKQILAEALDAFLAKLDGVTLADLMNITQERLPGFQALTFQPKALKVKA